MKTIDLTAETDFAHSFATRGRARDIVARAQLSPGETALIRVGKRSLLAPGFIQGLLGALGQERLVLVEGHTCPDAARAMFTKVAGHFRVKLEFS